MPFCVPRKNINSVLFLVFEYHTTKSILLVLERRIDIEYVNETELFYSINKCLYCFFAVRKTFPLYKDVASSCYQIKIENNFTAESDL